MWFGKDRSFARLILSETAYYTILVNISLPNERSLPNHVLCCKFRLQDITRKRPVFIGLLLTPTPSLQGSHWSHLIYEKVDSHDLFWKVFSQNGTSWNEEGVWAGTIHCSLSDTITLSLAL